MSHEENKISDLIDAGHYQMKKYELFEEATDCLTNILEIGKRDMSNPKYDHYFLRAAGVLKAIELMDQTIDGAPLVDCDRFTQAFDEPGTEKGIYVVGVDPCKDDLAPSDCSVWVKDGENGYIIPEWAASILKDKEDNYRWVLSQSVAEGQSLPEGTFMLTESGHIDVEWLVAQAFEDKTNHYPVKGLKKVARRLRIKEKQPSLTNILINLRSRYRPGWWFNEHIKEAVLNKGLVWDYGKRTHVLKTLKDKGVNIEGLNCPNTARPNKGHKTYFHEGEYYSYDPTLDEFPF